MAKKSTTNLPAVGGKKSIFEVIKSFDNSAEILGESKTAVIKDYIDTGNYMLNAAMTGSLFKGVPSGRVTVFAGPKGCGKSYLALSVCRSAQKMGYTPIYLDSEAAMDIDFITRLGCDTSNFIIKTVTTVSEVSTFIARTCKEMNEISEEDRPKVIFVIDSLGNLTSDKELADTIDGNDKRDMTRAQNIKALFRTNATALGRLGYPLICVAHTYQTQEMFSKTVVSGGCLVPDSIVITESGPKKISSIKEGEKVLDENGFFSSVVKTFRFRKPTIKMEFGIESESDAIEPDNPESSLVDSLECSRDHRFLVKVTEGDYQWKTAEDIQIGDKVMKITEYTSPVSDIKIRPKYDNVEVLSKVEMPETDVCDLCVDYSHTYVTDSGIINHNSGVNYNASLTMLLSTAKLDDKESDKIAEKRIGDFTKTGVTVTATPEKSRFTIPQKVKFYIPFFKAPNPYVGLEAYTTWENSGIMRGEIINEKEYGKLSPEVQKTCKEMNDKDGKKCYAKPKDTSKKIVVKHLGCEVPVAEFWSPKVLTDEILHNLDESIIRPSFELPSNESNDDLTEIINEADE